MNTVSELIEEAGELGILQPRIDDLVGRVRHAIDKGPLCSAQIALARHGKLVLVETFGEADNSTRYNIYSCTKPVVACAIWKLMGEGKIEIERPVHEYFPDFCGRTPCSPTPPDTRG